MSILVSEGKGFLVGLMAGRGDQILFEDIFTITEKDRGGKKFDKVSRVEGVSEQFEFDIILDVNVELYPVKTGEKYTIALATTLNTDGTPGDGTFDQSGRKSLMDKYEYVMHGKLYKYDDAKRGAKRIDVYVSFGGLLMKLSGDAAQAARFRIDQQLYLLMRKVG